MYIKRELRIVEVVLRGWKKITVTRSAADTCARTHPRIDSARYKLRDRYRGVRTFFSFTRVHSRVLNLQNSERIEKHRRFHSLLPAPRFNVLFTYGVRFFHRVVVIWTHVNRVRTNEYTKSCVYRDQIIYHNIFKTIHYFNNNNSMYV